MHFTTTILPPLLLLTPALSAPHPAPLNCDSLLSFSGPSEHAIVNIRAFCNRRRKLNTSLFKRSSSTSIPVASVFDLPSARSQQLDQGRAHQETRHNPVAGHEEQLYITTSHTPPQHPAHDDGTDHSQTHPAPHQHHPHPPHPHSTPHIKTCKQPLARLRTYTLPDFQHHIHSFLHTLSNTSDNLAVAGALAVFIVVVMLVGLERWMGARLRWARVVERDGDVVVVVDAEEEATLYAVDEKVALVEEVEVLVVEKGER